MTADGSRVAFIGPFREGSNMAPAGIIDVGSGRLRVVGRVPAYQAWGPQLSPDGSRLLFWSGYALYTLDVPGGRMRLVATHVAPRGAWDWLPDGRIAYLTLHRRLAFVTFGRRVLTPLRIPRVTGRRWARYISGELLASVAVSPDGSSALFTAEDCTVWMENLRTSRRHRVGRPYLSGFRSWSPDGSHFAVAGTPDFRGRECVPPRSAYRDVFLFRRGRGLVGRVTRASDELNTGIGRTWSTNGQWLLLDVAPTGTQVAGYVYLLAANVAHRTVTEVVVDRVASDAFADSGGHVVLSRYRYAEGASLGREQGRVIAGRLAGR
jgi:Tol biopolymer transport system component